MVDAPKTALITGSATRVGRVIALYLAQHGWNIAVHYGTSGDQARQTVEELQSLGVHAAAFQADLGNADALEPFIARAHEILGPITALINCAAIFERDTPDSFSAEQFDRQLHINLRAPLILAQHFAQQLPEEAQGNIVNITDGGGAFSLTPSFFTYALSKQGLDTATRMLAQHYAPRIRVNAVAPGLTLPQPGDEADFNRLVAQSPLQVPSEPDDLAQAVHFVLTTPSISGQVIAVNGGKTRL